MSTPFTASLCTKRVGRRNGDGAVVRRSSKAGADDGAACPFHNNLIVIFFSSSSSGENEFYWGADRVWTRGQEDEERKAIQRVVRKRSTEEGEEDRAHQGQG